MTYLHVSVELTTALSRVQWNSAPPSPDKGAYLRGDCGSLPLALSGQVLVVVVAHFFVFLLVCTQSLLSEGQSQTHLDPFLVVCLWWLCLCIGDSQNVTTTISIRLCINLSFMTVVLTTAPSVPIRRIRRLGRRTNSCLCCLKR